MAEIIAANLLKDVLSKLASEAMKIYARSQGIHSELENLESTLTHIQALLKDASQKEIADEAVKVWLKSLRHLAYDIDDILDGLAIEVMDRQFTEESGSITSKVRKLIPTFYTDVALDNKLHHKLENITTKFQDLANQKKSLGLTVKDESPKERNRKFQTSLVDVSSIVGRHGEKESLVRRLLGDETSDQNFSVVPIVGMGGVGKTTLARLLYDEKQVKDHFEVKAWVCVSDEFDSFSISKVIFQSVGGENKEEENKNKTEFADLNLLQEALRDQIREKRFLIVLDDVWSESCDDWETLVRPFYTCGRGSKIIITTRKEQLVKNLCYDNLNHLQSLSHDDALCLFARHALGVNDFDSHSKLKPHGEDIVKKCDGLPLALIALGRLLRTKKDDEVYWEEVLNSEIWRLQHGDGIVAALRLSYHDLSAPLKQLFAYCSLFPKDYMFQKEELVQLWMAEGFLPHSSSCKSTTERLGSEYFEELLSRSFFEHAPNNESLFVMHDLMNDLATSVAEDFFVRLDNEMDYDIQEETLNKYMSFVRTEYVAYKKFKAFRRIKSLRTFLGTSIGLKKEGQTFYLSNKILVDLLPELPLLRVISLSGYEIREVPDCIGNLKHLRYLNLSQTKITHLPENVGNLYNLQTLILFSCQNLIKLPKSFIQLKNLRHFDIRDTPLLNKMPLGIGKLKSLQTLSKIIIGDENRFEITNFSQKILSELEVAWSDVFNVSRKEMLEKELLNELEPNHDNLKQLKIMSYGGREFPNWVGDPLFLQLKHVSLRGCKRCIGLPPLGQLPSLKEMFIEGLDGVKVVGLELLGTGLAFLSLETLTFKDMQGWEEWLTNGRDVFPCLQKLVINNCPNLDVISLVALPSLRVLKIIACGNGVLSSLVQVASLVTLLLIKSISGLTYEVWGGVIKSLSKIEELYIRECNEIRYLWESKAKASRYLVNLRKLEVKDCDKLVRLGEKEEDDNVESNLMMMPSLRNLNISFCNNLECCSCPGSIETLRIWDCDAMTGNLFPIGGGQKLKSLVIKGEEKSSSVVINNTGMPMLETLWIHDWVNLKSIIDLNSFTNLTRLAIGSCENLESFPDLKFSKLSLLKHLMIGNCPSMDASFPRGRWPPNLQILVIGGLKKPMSEWVPQDFPPSLVKLTLHGGLKEDDDLIDFSKLSHLFSSSLTSLEIWRFEKLKNVSKGLQHLTFLQHLIIRSCPKVKYLPEMLLPSLLSLTIDDCPKLKKRCKRSGRGYWPLISHIPKIELEDHE